MVLVLIRNNIIQVSVPSNPLMFLLLSALSLCAAAPVSADLLDDYVNANPQFVRYEFLPQYDYSGNGSELTPASSKSWTARCVNLTSQAWLSEDDWGADWGGAQGQWWHFMYIITPSEVTSPGWRGLYITHGKNTDDPPPPNGELIFPFLLRVNFNFVI